MYIIIIYNFAAEAYIVPMPQKIMTANRLSDGAVVYLLANGSFGEDVNGSQTADEDQTGDLEAKAADAVAVQHIVAPYLIDVEANGGAIVPVRYREKIRASGPTTLFGPDK